LLKCKNGQLPGLRRHDYRRKPARAGGRRDSATSREDLRALRGKGPADVEITDYHPGRILLEDLKDERISINGLARAIRAPANRISPIVNEKRGISADTAARLGRYFGTSAQYWLNIQNRFDLDSLDKAAIERDVLPKTVA
jgi:addiction module HigA family antidote